MTGLDNREPLPVGMHLRGEPLEDGMLRIRQNAKGPRRYLFLVILRDGLKHAEVPVVGGKESAYTKVCGIGHQ